MARGRRTQASTTRQPKKVVFHRPRPEGLHAAIRQVPAPQEAFQPLPSPTGASPFHLDVGSVLGADSVKAITSSGSMSFHVAGDTGGIQLPLPQQHVADAMEADFSSDPKPAFFYHLGDVVYFCGEASNYFAQFYEPYMHYPAPIFAIPGNHDGDLADPSAVSLSAFVNNFCSPAPKPSPDALDSPRTTMVQPNVFWTLLTPLATFVGLYSNVPQGGVIKPDQAAWLVNELKTAPKDRALIVSLHHPPFSADLFHAGSLSMVEVLDNAFQQSGRVPDIVFAGHVHNYQRFTRMVGSRQVPYIVAGAGGYHNLHRMQKDPNGNALAVPYTMPEAGLTLENYCDTMYGYLMLTATSTSVHGEYFAIQASAQPTPLAPQRIDVFELSLKDHALTTSGVVPPHGAQVG